MRVLVACEFSGVVRSAFRARGHDAWSVDLLPAEDGSKYHYQRDALEVAGDWFWDLMIAHPPCTRLANSGVRWLHERHLWADLGAAVAFYSGLSQAPIARIAIENPIMHRYAREALGNPARHVVQPWWFGDPAFKATGFELRNLPPLRPTNRLTPPKPGTSEHKAWSAVHREPPGPDRWKNRSRTFPGLAAAMAEQWGSAI